MINLDKNGVLASIIDVARELDECEAIMKQAQEAESKKKRLVARLVELVRMYDDEYGEEDNNVYPIKRA